MNNRDAFNESITPEEGDKFVNIPITLDSRPGRGGRGRGQMIANWAIMALWVFLMFITFKNGEIGILSKILRALLFTIGLSLVARFIVMRELKVERQYSKLEEVDYQFNTSKMWGIYGQSSVYPTIFYGVGGKLISVVKMNKDVTMGKEDSDLYNHFEAISDALNYAGVSGLKVMHIDYMDSVGNDDRLDAWYDEVVETKNPDFKDFYSLMYNHLVESVESRMSFEDVYVLSSMDTESLFAFKVDQFTLEMRRGNYTSFKYLNREEIQDIVCNLYNIHEFSFIEAAQGVFNREEIGNIVPIEVISGDVYTKLNLTRAERIERSKEAEESKKMAKQKRVKKDSKDDEENLDIF